MLFSLLKKLNLIDAEMLGWKVVSPKATRYDAAQLAAVGTLQSIVKYCKGLPETFVRRENAESSSSSSGGDSMKDRSSKVSMRERSRKYGFSISHHMK